MRRTVVFVSVPTGLGGSTRSLANLLGYLDGDVERVLVAPAGGRFVEHVRAAGGAETHLAYVSSRPPRPPRRVASAWRITRYVLRHRAPVAAIHANGLKELSMSLPAALLSRRRLVVWIHNYRLPPSIRILGWLWRILLPRLDVRWAAVSPLARDLVMDAGLARAEDVVVVPNPIDPADLLASPPRTPPGPGEPVTVAFLGSPLNYKGFDLLPRIIDAVDPALPVRWLVFSHQVGDALAGTWTALRAMPPERDVVLKGKLTDVSQAYAQCDIVLCPSRLDSFCRVAAEAMINGLPVVGSDLEPIVDLLGKDEAGLVFPVEDVRAAASAVERLVRDPALRAELGAVGRTRAAAYSPEVVRDGMLALYGVRPRTGPTAATRPRRS